MDHRDPSLGRKHLDVKYHPALSNMRTEESRSIFSTAYEPALSYIMTDFKTDSESLATFTISVYLIGFCFGPILFAPASELYGRVTVLYPSFIVYLVALAICGSSTNLGTFTVFRLLMGMAGTGFLICGRAVIADIIPLHRRGLALSFMTSAPTLVSGARAGRMLAMLTLIDVNRVPR